MTLGCKPAITIALLLQVSASSPASPGPGPVPGVLGAADARAPAATAGERPSGFDLQAWLDSQHGKEGNAADWAQITGAVVDKP